MQDIITTPDKPLVPQNGTAQIQSQQVPSAINKLLEANTPLVIWLIFFAIGGGILALYYARIGYLPDIEWKAALIYLFIGSIVGGVIGLLLTISLYLPGVIWSESIVFDRCLNFFYFPPQKQAGKEPVPELCIRTIFGYLGLPYLAVLLLSHIALFFGNVFYWVFAISFLVLTFVVMRILLRYRLLPANNSSCITQKPWAYVWSNLTLKKRKKKSKGSSEDDSLEDRHAFKLSSSFTLSVFLNQISMYLIYRLYGSPVKLRTFVALTILCTAGVWINAHIVALRHRDHSRQAVFASLVAAGLLLFTAENFSSLSMKLMQYYGFGDKHTVNVLINPDKPTIIEDLQLTDSKCPPRTLCNIEILSKVGNEYFLKAGDRTFTLSKSDVISFSQPKGDAYPAVTAR